MSDDETDYMSAIFVDSAVKEDIRPGLINSHSGRRKHDLLKKKKVANDKNKQENKPIHVFESEKRDEGLNSAISSGNKGFSILQKMGFKPGSGLGKSESGITEPVAIELKNDRLGFGRREALKQLKLSKQRFKTKHQQSSLSVGDYRSFLSKKSKAREIESDLRKSQKACQNLDLLNGVKVPAEEWFWSIYIPDEEYDTYDDSDNNKDESEEVQDFSESEENLTNYDFDPSEKLEMLTTYLRQTYYYCVWCGTQYDDEKDLQSCPGFTRDDH